MPASRRASAARLAPESVGTTGITGGPGEIVTQHVSLALDSLAPSPFASKATFPVLQSVVGAMPASTVAWTLMVTVPQTGMEPFQETVLSAVVTVPLVAVAVTRVNPAGSVSMNSAPGLSACAFGPPLLST